MPAVTALLPDPRGSGGYTVFVDGVSFALVAAADLKEQVRATLTYIRQDGT